MVKSWPRNTKKETEEKTTERTISTCTAWSHSTKEKSSPDFRFHHLHFMEFFFLYQFLWRTRTTKFLWSCQSGSCTTGLSSPVRPTPTRTGKRNETQSTGQLTCVSRRTWPVNPPITTFSMVAMNSIARVSRCSRITKMSRTAIFKLLQKERKKEIQIFSEKKSIFSNRCFCFVTKHWKHEWQSVLCARGTETPFFLATSLGWNVLTMPRQPC